MIKYRIIQQRGKFKIEKKEGWFGSWAGYSYMDAFVAHWEWEDFRIFWFDSFEDAEETITTIKRLPGDKPQVMKVYE